MAGTPTIFPVGGTRVNKCVHTPGNNSTPATVYANTITPRPHAAAGAEAQPLRRAPALPRLARDGHRPQERAARLRDRVSQTVHDTADEHRHPDPAPRRRQRIVQAAAE